MVGCVFLAGARLCLENNLVLCLDFNINEAQNLTPRQAAIGRILSGPMRHPRSGQFRCALLGGYHCDEILGPPILRGDATKPDLFRVVRSSIVHSKGRYTLP